jgi:LytS/YehU family sensor histidine kinase
MRPEAGDDGSLSWSRITIYVAALIVFPEVVGFVYGVSMPLWRSLIAGSTALWLRRVCIGIVTLLIYILLARSRSRRFAHVAAVFLVTTGIDVVLGVSLGQPATSMAAWIGVSVLAAAVGLLLAPGRDGA